MPISAEEIQRLARLAGLSLGEEETAELALQMGSILEHLDALRRVDPGEAPLPPAAAALPLRDDAVAFDPLLLPPASLAPDWQQGLFLVPRLAALDPDAPGGEPGG